MKQIAFLFLLLGSAATVFAKEKSYAGSTPAGDAVRVFLGIPLSDSVDFIRWRITINNNRYRLHGNYGINQPNTNGFFNGGTTVAFQDVVSVQSPFLQFQHAGKILVAVILNDNLLHLVDNDKHLLTGNGGWSYTLNSTVPLPATTLQWKQPSVLITDSLNVEGRSPCGVPGIKPPGELCYKLKWHIIFYTDAVTHAPTRYNMPSVPYHKEGGRKGKWKMVKADDGRIMYQLFDAKDQVFLYLMPIDDNLLVFTDAHGVPLVGDEDFSYTLNRRQLP